MTTIAARYMAVDGKTFESKEECEAHESYPILWVVSRRYNSYDGTSHAVLDMVFLTESEATEYCEDKTKKENSPYEEEYFTYSILGHLLVPYIKEEEKEEKEEKVFNIPVESTLSQEVAEERKTAWDKIRLFLSKEK